MKYLILVVPLLFMGCSHNCPSRLSTRGGEVTSFGYAEIKAAPDIARFTVEVGFTRATVKEASEETQKIMGEVVEACRKTVVDPNDVRTTRISINKEFEWVNNANVFKGFAASQSVEVTLRDLSRMETLTQGILETRVSALNNLEFDHSKADSLRNEANALAMADARQTVQKMCLAVNRNCEELVAAKTVETPGSSPVFDRGFAGAMSAKVAPAGISVNPGLLRFAASVEATYRSK